jgi:hypothetical protein
MIRLVNVDIGRSHSTHILPLPSFPIFSSEAIIWPWRAAQLRYHLIQFYPPWRQIGVATFWKCIPYPSSQRWLN